MRDRDKIRKTRKELTIIAQKAVMYEEYVKTINM